MRVHVAVLLVTDAHTSADEATVKLVIERLGAAGHAVVECAVEKDSQQFVRAHFLRWIADSEVDVVIAVAGVDTEATTPALAPSITKKLEGFSDLFRMISYQEIGTGAMLVDVTAAQCGSTFVFVLPASNAAVKSAVDKIIIPQLDHRTRPRNLVTRMPRLRDAVARLSHLRTNDPPNGVPAFIPKEDTEVAGVPPPARGDRRPAAPDQPADASLTAPVTSPLKPVLVHPRSAIDSQPNPIDSASTPKRTYRSPTSPGERALAAVWGDASSADSGAISSGTPKAVEPNPTVQSSAPPPPGPPGNRHPRPKTEPSSPPPLARSTATPLAFVKARLEGTASGSTTVPTKTPFSGTPAVSATTSTPATTSTGPAAASGVPASPAAAAKSAPAVASSTVSAAPTTASEAATSTSSTAAPTTTSTSASTVSASSPTSSPGTSTTTASTTTASTPSASTTGSSATSTPSTPSTTTSPSTAGATTPANDTSSAKPGTPANGTSTSPKPGTPAGGTSTSTKPGTPATGTSTAKPGTPASGTSTSTASATAPASGTSTGAKPGTPASGTPTAPANPSASQPTTVPASASTAAQAASASTPASATPATATPATGTPATATPASGTATVSPPPTRPNRPTPPPPPAVALRTKTTSTGAAVTPIEARPTNGKSAVVPSDDDLPMLDDADVEASASSSGILARDLRKASRESDPTLPTRDGRASTAGAPKRKSKLPFVIVGIALLASSAFVIAGMNRDSDPPAKTAQATLPTTTQPTPTPPPPTPEPTPPPPIDPAPTPTEGSATPGEGSAAVVDPPADPPSEPATPTEEPKPADSEKPKKPTKKPRVANDEPKEPKEPAEVKEPKQPEPRDGGCDEVSCVMDKYARACCAKYKPADSGYKPQVKPAGEVPATLDKTMIRTGTAKVKGAIIECGVKANAKGTVKVSVNVEPDGKVGSSSVVSSPDPELGDCVAAAIRKATYGRTVNGGTFTYPFVF